MRGVNWGDGDPAIEYMHKYMPRWDQSLLAKASLTADEWHQVLKNPEIIAKLPELMKSFLADNMQ